MRFQRLTLSILLASIVTQVIPVKAQQPDTPGSIAPASAAAADSLRQLVERQQRVIEEQNRRLATLEAERGDTWLNERRAAEVKALVQEVLSDADTRASLLGSGLNAGYDRGFFIGTEDGNNLLKINLLNQSRYIFNSRDDGDYSQSIRTAIPGGGTRVTTTTNDELENGFQLRRLQLNFSGNFIDPRWTYRVRLANDAEGGTIRTDWAYIGYQLTDDIDIRVGQLKPPFLREEFIGAAQQLAVERSFTADYFTADFSQGIAATWWKDRLQLSGAIHDGSYGWRTEFDSDRTNLAIAGRAEYVLVGDVGLIRQKGWRQLSDFTNWQGEPTAVLLGAAVDYEWGESGGLVTQTNPVTDVSTGVAPDIFKYTADVSVEHGIWNGFLSFTGQRISDHGADTIVSGVDTIQDATQYGVVAQIGAFIIPDKLQPFARFEWIDFDDSYYRNDTGAIQTWVTGSVLAGTPAFIPAEELSILTVGANYYFKKHSAKFTADVMYIFDAVPVANRGQGILASSEGGQIVARTQLQINF